MHLNKPGARCSQAIPCSQLFLVMREGKINSLYNLHLFEKHVCFNVRKCFLDRSNAGWGQDNDEQSFQQVS